MNWLINRHHMIARTATWVGVVLIVILSTVPATGRPVTGAGHLIEHFAIFALVAGAFSIGYRISLVQRLLFVCLFCGFIELLQIPLLTRHARIADFLIDLLASWVGIVVVFSSETFMRLRQQHSS